MAGFEERIYQLGVEALAEQERQVTEVRTRGSTLLAAGAVIASLLAKPVFHSGHPSGVGETVSTFAGLVGAVSLLVFVVLLLRPYKLGFCVNASATHRALWDQGILEEPMVDLALADAFEEQREQNVETTKRLILFLGIALIALIVETAGLGAAAALAS